jgi:hypothetical protein
MNKFKVGDRVIKARAYSSDKYVRWGGGKHVLPLGTKGTIVGILSNPYVESVSVKFDNGVSWYISCLELDIEDSNWDK